MKLVISDYITRLDVTKQMQLYDLLIVRTEPLWSIKIRQDSTNVFALNEALYSFGIDDSKEYLTSNKSKFIGLGILFLIFLSILFWLRIKYRTLSDELKLEHTTGEFIVSRPIISAIMLMLLWALWTLPQMPHFLDNLVSILFLVPFLFIFHRIVQKPLRGSLYYFFVIFLVVNLSPFFYIGDAISRIALIIESLFIAGFLFWFIRKKKSITPENRTSGFWYQFLNFIRPVYLVIIVAAIFGNIIGYESLNNLVTYGILVSLLLGLIFGTAYFALRGLTLLFTATTLVRVSNIIKKDQHRFLIQFDKILWTATVIAWFYFTLRSFQLWEPFYRWFRSVLEIGYGFRNIQITIGGIINFFLIIIFSWLLSRFIRLILQEEILQRFNLPRGIPMAISSLTQYTLVFIGVVLALAYAGFDLQNLGIMAGALGVGIGFGLQNLVGNFISGLILVFERPVTVDDIVKLDLYEGTVVSIGIRSSVIRQWDGSRIIVPNSDLISFKVLNWTMTNYERRFIIRIHTPPDTDPDLVIKLMTESASGEDLVLGDPAPQTYFIVIVDQAYAFDLFFWVSRDILVARSNVNLAVQKKLKAAGIKVLLPKKLEIEEPIKARTGVKKATSRSTKQGTAKPDLKNNKGEN
jgi:small-conductance mechanosensitive channel